MLECWGEKKTRICTEGTGNVLTNTGITWRLRQFWLVEVLYWSKIRISTSGFLEQTFLQEIDNIQMVSGTSLKYYSVKCLTTARNLPKLWNSHNYECRPTVRAARWFCKFDMLEYSSVLGPNFEQEFHQKVHLSKAKRFLIVENQLSYAAFIGIGI